MIAAFGGNTVRCAEYATYGTKELSENALKALEGRSACLLANHGMIAPGPSLAKAMWAAVELETIAKQYYYALVLGSPVILSDDRIEDTQRGFATYGLQEMRNSPAEPPGRRAIRGVALRAAASRDPRRADNLVEHLAAIAPPRPDRGM